MKQLIQHWVTRQAEQRPDAAAIVWKNVRVTYRELEEHSNRLAAVLKRQGAVRGDRIAFCMAKSPEAITAMLGVLKADCMYVPVDVECPASRVEKILTACEPAGVLVDASGARLMGDVLRSFAGPRPFLGTLEEMPLKENVLATDFCGTDIAAESSAPHVCENDASDGAHILFTSGSTGTPKGVVVTHSSVITYINWTLRYFGIDETDRVSGHAPLHFDLSTQDIYGAFAAGAELHPVPPEYNLLPRKLAAFIQDHRLTQWFSVPSVLNYLCRFDAVPENGFPHLRRLMWCGEVLPTPTLIYLMQKLPSVQFTNLYGPTEATIASSFYTVPECPASETESIPIGTACDGEELLVLDEQRLPVGPGEIGDLYIAGAGLSPGYWRDPEKTASVFLPDPRSIEPRRIYRTGDLARMDEEGRVWFLGRADTQIKSRGYRIELGEIETALHAIDVLEESAVVAIETGGFENMAICCAWVPAGGADISAADVRTRLAESVPRYMLPRHWLQFDRLPKNANGKIDRPRLKADFREAFLSQKSGTAVPGAAT